MTKLKTPLLSLGATQSIGDSLTFQRRNKTNFVRRKPHPTDSRSVAQLSHRENYLYCIQCWKALTAARKHQWETAARPYRITGFNLFLRQRLPDYSDFLLRYFMDENAGTTLCDNSRSKYHGNITGASYVVTPQNYGLYFDGSDDFVTIPDCPDLNFTSEDFSLKVRLKMTSITEQPFIFRRGRYNTDGYRLDLGNNAYIRFLTFQTPAFQMTWSNAGVVPTGSWCSIVITRTGAAIKLFRSGVDVTDNPDAHTDPATCSRAADISVHEIPFTERFHGTIDYLAIFPFHISDADALILSQE